MRRWRHLIAVILIYITLDLSLASMPGAFVFDAGDAVESALMHRTEDVAATVTMAPFARPPRAAAVEHEVPVKPRFAATAVMPRIRPRTDDSSPTASAEPASSSEDPH